MRARKPSDLALMVKIIADLTRMTHAQLKALRIYQLVRLHEYRRPKPPSAG